MRHRLQSAPSYTNQVFDIIREQILSGSFSPGERLNEVELAEKLGTSRSPIREALQRLSSEGLVNLVPKKGAFVFTLDPQEIEESFEVREVLEIAAVRFAVERADDRDLQKLEEILETTKRTIKKTSHYPRDINFHLQVFAAAGNSKLESVYSEINTKIQLAQTLSVSDLDRASSAYDEHLPIFKALQQRDADEAERAMRRHIRHAKSNILRILAALTR
jgi:DNA-binding GntR family transcriptional regulator